MGVEWDEHKRRKTLDERGLDFADLEDIDWGTALTLEDVRQPYPETRYTPTQRSGTACVLLPGATVATTSGSSAFARQTAEKRRNMTGTIKPYIDRDGEVRELDDHFFASARRGRPALPADRKKRQVTIMLDPDIIDRLKVGGRGWQTRANALLREALGLTP